MSRGAETVHIHEAEDGTFVGLWGPFVLKSAFQPIFRFDGGRLLITAFEGLIRPFRDGEGVRPPAFFASIPVGERLHVENLTRNLHLLNAGRFLDPSTKLFVNFNPSVFVDREMAIAALRNMRRTLHSAKIDPRRVVCEVTEQKSTSEQALVAFVSVLRDHGFRIAVDDYGAQESDLERVAALKPDIVKFDAQWINRLMDTRPGLALLSVMVHEFRSRGITVVFEGIEEHWQLEQAEEAGAHMVQGYVLARPELAPASFGVFSGEQGPEPAAIVSREQDSESATEMVTGRQGPVLRRPFGRRSAS